MASSSITAAPLPPLPDLSAAPGTGPTSSATDAGPGSGLAQMLSGIMPVKRSVDMINAACQQIVQYGAVPGSEQICAQIISLATSLMPMAAQNLMQPMGGGGGIPMPPPPGGPQPILNPPGGGAPAGGPIQGM